MTNTLAVHRPTQPLSLLSIVQAIDCFTPHQYLIRQRVERAKLLLKDGKMGILEVAIACSFTHQSHLNRHFKRITGVTQKKIPIRSNFVQKQQDCARLCKCT